MKKILILIMAAICLPLVTKAQLYVDSLGIVQIRNIKKEIFTGFESWSKDTCVCLNVRGRGYWWSKGKITIGDGNSIYAQNISLGEVCNGDGDTDQMWLHGKRGLYYTCGNHAQDTIFYYDVSRGNDFHFNCNVLASNISVASDSRFKKDIKPLDSSLESITSLSPVSYKLKPRFGQNDITDIPGGLTEKEMRDFEYFNKFHKSLENDGEHFGFLAQEVKEVYPELVHTDSDGYMYVDYIGMIPLLVGAINELNAQIEELKAEKEGLENQVHYAKAIDYSGEPEEELTKNVLYQNNPNPFTASTSISMSLRTDVNQAAVYVFDMQGSLIKTIPVSDRGNVAVTIEGSELNAGMYIYSLIADGKEIASKRMILTK
ncbi:MAG: tail fiber domain-containing protein [Bacteroidales bacterium]|nr:tail fiber domain-containing protein [Bacteroidales bacterium]